MDSFSLLLIIMLIVIIYGMYLLLNHLYIGLHHGKLIIKANESKSSIIVWVVFLIIWSLLLLLSIRGNTNHKNSFSINDILINICWIEISILNIVRALRCSEIRENGIYDFSEFYKWPEIKSYSWISQDTIQFRVNKRFKINKKFKINIKEEMKLRVDELVKKYIVSNV